MYVYVDRREVNRRFIERIGEDELEKGVVRSGKALDQRESRKQSILARRVMIISSVQIGGYRC